MEPMAVVAFGCGVCVKRPVRDGGKVGTGEAVNIVGLV